MRRRSATASLPQREAEDAVGAVGGVKPWSCTATATASKQRVDAEQREAVAQCRGVEVAAAHLDHRPAGMRSRSSPAAPSPTTRTPAARTRSRSSAKVSAACSVATKAWPARRCAFIAAPSAPPPMSGPLKTTVWPRAVAAAICAATTCVREGTTSLTAFSRGSPGCVSRMSAVPAPTSTARMRAPRPPPRRGAPQAPRPCPPAVLLTPAAGPAAG